MRHSTPWSESRPPASCAGSLRSSPGRWSGGPPDGAFRRAFRPDANLRRRRRAVVIGAGLGGLAVALRLLHKGLDVVVLEREPEIGVRAAQIRARGFTFDVGPSLITMPRLLEGLFDLAGVRLADRLRMHRLDPFYRISWQDETRSFLFSGEREAMLQQIGQFSAADARRYDAFLAASRRIYERGVLRTGRPESQHFSGVRGL